MASKYSIFAVVFTLITICKSETLNRFATDYTPVGCTAFPCIINCVATSSCRETNISCPITGNGECIINLIGTNAAYESTINTHFATIVNITVYGSTASQYSTIYAHKKIGAKLKIHVTGSSGMRNSKIFAPYGEGSQLTIVAGETGTNKNYQIADCEIFEDSSTKVVFEGYRPYAFDSTIVKNIFTSNPYFNINKPGTINPNYRAPVRLYSEYYAYRYFQYFGTDHGDWNILSYNPSSSYIDFLDAIVHADHSFVTNESYTISVISAAYEAMHLNLYASQNNANIIIRGLASRAFWNGGDRYLKVNCLPTLSNGETYAINTFTAFTTGTYGFYRSTVNINTTISGNVTFISDIHRGFEGGTTAESGSYSFGNILGSVLIISNSTATTNCNRGFYRVNMQFDSIAETLQIRDTTVLGEGFYDSMLTVHNTIGGDVIMDDDNSNGGYMCRYSEFYLGDINGNVILTQNNLKGYMFDNSIFNMGSIGSNLLITDNSQAGRILPNSQFTTGDILGDIIMKDLSGSAGGYSYYDTDFTFGNVDGKIELIQKGVIGKSFEKSTFTMNSIGNGLNGGGLYINDSAIGGRAIFDAVFTVNGDINGDVFIIDNNNGTGHTGYSTDFTWGNCKSVTLITQSYTGYSFKDATFNIGDIDGSLFIAAMGFQGHTFEDAQITTGSISGDVIIHDQTTDNSWSGGRMCYKTQFEFGDVGGKIDLISISAAESSFREATFIINSIGSDLTAHDISFNGRGFVDTYFDIGIISGNALFRDDAYGSGGGSAIYQSDIIIRHIDGNINLIDLGDVGRAFYQTNFDFGYIGGNLYAEAVKNTQYDQSFFETNWQIGTVKGNVTFKAYVNGAFWGYNKATILNISNAESNIDIFTVGDYGFRNVQSYFGGNPNVEIKVEGGYHGVYTSTFDCRNCKKFTLRCNNADCDGGVKLYCPQNNSLDTCKIYCSKTSGCNGMDIFTTNGYCEDVRIYCLDTLTNGCNIGSNTKVYCTNNGMVNYGNTSYSCPMQKDSAGSFDNNWFCGTGECSNSCTEKPTHSPIPSPSLSPTPAPSLSPTLAPSSSPTPAPTKLPTRNPTPAPTTFPTKNPTTPRPTTPDQLFCGDSDTGSYSGVPLLFNVQLNFFGDLIFNAAQSSFNVTSMEAYSKLNVLLATDVSSDGQFDKTITLLNTIPGDYKFWIHGDKSGLYNVQITCISQSPTATPTNYPTPAPTQNPTPAPTFSPTKYPTNAPTTPPTNTPTTPPTFLPTQTPTYSPTSAPSNIPTIDPTHSPTTDPTIDPTINPTQDPTNDPTQEPTIDPTNNPSITPTKNPTNEPTPSPSKAPTVDIIAAIVNHKNAQQNQNSQLNITDLFLIIAACAIVMGCCCICCYFGYKSYKMKRKRSLQDIQNMNKVINMNNMSPTNTTNCGDFSPTGKSPSPLNKEEGFNDFHNNNNNTNNKDLNLPTSLFEDVGYVIKINNDDEKGQDNNIEMSHFNLNPLNKMKTHTIQRTGEIDEDDLNDLDNDIHDVKMMNMYIKSANQNQNNINLKTWLNNLQLVEYFDAFKQQGFENHISSLAEITEQDLKDMGVTMIAHRRTIMKQVRTLKLNMNGNHKYFMNVENNNNDYKIDTFNTLNTYKPQQRNDDNNNNDALIPESTQLKNLSTASAVHKLEKIWNNVEANGNDVDGLVIDGDNETIANVVAYDK